MTIKTFCNRCGTECTYSAREVRYDTKPGVRTFDICEECFVELKRWVDHPVAS